MCTPSVYSHSSIVNKNKLNNNMKQVTELKHRNCIIVANSTEQFPEMVKIIKTPKIREIFLNRRYLNLAKCYMAIETFESDRLINNKETYVKAQLEEVVIISEGEDYLNSGSEESEI
jgi:hypothetical protein